MAHQETSPELDEYQKLWLQIQQNMRKTYPSVYANQPEDKVPAEEKLLLLINCFARGFSTSCFKEGDCTFPDDESCVDPYRPQENQNEE